MDRYRYRRRRQIWPYLVAGIILLGGYCYWSLSRELKISPIIDTSTLVKRAPDGRLDWPAKDQSAVGIVGSPILEAHHSQKAVPTASTAKLITALLVLQKKPLLLGEQGPVFTLNKKDVAIYNKYYTQNGSLVKVRAGERITEYEMLETILLPSANNMADSLAIKVFGSLKNYTAAANQYLKTQGLVYTNIGKDASGFAPNTKSNAGDLVKIGELVMENPVLAQIVGKTSASKIPVAGKIKNRNLLIGTDNIIGIKTGNTDEAGGVFVSASQTKVNDKTITIVTALMGSKSLIKAMRDSIPLIRSAQVNFKPITVISAGSTLGIYKLPWGGNLKAVADKSLILDTWAGNVVNPEVYLQDLATNGAASQHVGSVVIPESALSDQSSVPIKLQSVPAGPSVWWRLTHPFN